MLKYVKISFVFAGLLMWMITTDIVKSLFNLINPNFDKMILGHQFTVGNLLGFICGIITTFILWKNEKINSLSMEVATEMKRVTWPNWNETRTSTFIVIVTTIIVSLILGLFDYIWASITSLIYGV